MNARPGDGDIREQIAAAIEAECVASTNTGSVCGNCGKNADIARNFPLPTIDGATVDEAAVGDETAEWLDTVLDAMVAEAKRATTPEQAFHIAIRAVHAVRRLRFTVDNGYYGAFKSRMAIQRVSGIHLGDYPERAIIDAAATVPTSPTEAVDEGRRLASKRDDLIASGVDPATLEIPLAGPTQDELYEWWCPACGEGGPPVTMDEHNHQFHDHRPPTVQPASDDDNGLRALAEKFAAVKIPQTSEGRDQRAYDYWRGYRDARDECVESLNVLAAHPAPTVTDEMVERVVTATAPMIPNTNGTVWFYEHEDGQRQPVTLTDVARAALSAALGTEEGK